MNRRDFLLSTTGLALAPTIVRGQATDNRVRADIDPYFIKHAAIFETSDGKFGVSASELEELINKVCFRVYREAVPHVAGISTARLALLIRDEADSVMKQFAPQAAVLLKQWLYAEAVCAWVRTHVTFDKELEAMSGDVQHARTTPQSILNMEQPRTICSGYAQLARDLSRATGRSVGLKCFYVGGWSRGYDGKTPEVSNHGWNCFQFQGDILVPADITASAQTREQALKCKWKTAVELVLPRTKVTWEIFLASHFGVIKFDDDIYSYFEPKTLTDRLSGLKLEAWKACNIAYLGELQRRLDNLEVH